MAWPKGRHQTKKSVELRINKRAQTLLARAKKTYHGDERTEHFNSIIHWDTLCLHKTSKGRGRRFVTVMCGKCKKDRWTSFDNLIKDRQKPTFTGLCQNCWYSLTWLEKNRDRPPKRKVNSNGYIRIYLGVHHPMADKRGEIFEHRLVMSKMLGRPLKRWEHVHHKDGNRANNLPENLELVTTQQNQVMRDTLNRIAQLEALLNQHHIPIPR